MFRSFGFLVVLLFGNGQLIAADGKLEIFPPKLVLSGRDSSAQILVTKILPDGTREDLTAEASFEPSRSGWLKLTGGRAFNLSG